VKQFSVNVEGAMDATNALVKEAQVALKNITGPHAFINKGIVEHHPHERRILCLIYNNPTNHLSTKKVNIF
jgi:hypothetical protein